MKHLIGKGYCLFLDNWYTSVELVRCLLANKTDCIGTLRKNRKGLPKELLAEKLNVGESICAFDSESNLMITK